MKQSILFIPDISGFTDFVQSTEAAHSQHVIAEILEVLIRANISGLELAEIEGDALFFYKEDDTLSQERLLAQIEHMFNEFYSHLKMFEQNRICPCNACSTAPALQLKIVVHSGELQFIEVRGNRKPFGQAVIKAHRMLKNSIKSDNYVMISGELATNSGMPEDYNSKLYVFKKGHDEYDKENVEYIYSIIDPAQLSLKSVQEVIHMKFDREADFSFARVMPVSAQRVYEVISNYRFRHEWEAGVDRYEFNDNEVTRKGSEHVCVINGKHLDFVVVSTDTEPGHLVYGELTETPPFVDNLVRMFYIDSLSDTSARLRSDVYLNAKSPLKKFVLTLGVRKMLKKNFLKSMDALGEFLKSDHKKDQLS